MKTLLKMAALVTSCLCMTSCWAPEEFTSTLAIDKTLNFQFTFEGTMAFWPALGEIMEFGQLSAEGNAEMKTGEAELRNEPGFVSAVYLGRGRYRVRYQETGPIASGKELFLGLVEFSNEPGGRIRVMGLDIDDEGRQELVAAGLKLNGTIKVTTGLTVVEHNATSTPSLGRSIGAYAWHLTLAQKQRPMVLLQQ